MKPRRRGKRILNCVPSRNTQNDWLYEHATAARGKTKASLPSSKDLRASWWRIGNQGDTGACVGWAAADSVLRWYIVKAGKLKPSERLSVRFLWMASKELDIWTSHATTFLEGSGTSIKTALDVARKYGLVKDSVLPFNGKLSRLDEEQFYALAANLKIASYYNLVKGNKLENIKKWLVQHGPVLTRLDCDKTWDNISAKGILDKYNKPDPDAGHAVAIVGYTKDHFIIRNSWGTAWGHKGFAYATPGYAEEAFQEAYGVLI